MISLKRTTPAMPSWTPTFSAVARRIAKSAVPAALAIALGCALPAAANAQTKLVVAKVANDFALVMGDYGKSLGMFKKHGLDVDFPLIQSAKAVQAMVAGSVDMTMGSGGLLLFAAKGAPMKAVAALDGPPSMLVLAVAADSKIKTSDDLKGKTIAISRKGSLTDWAVAQLASAKGWPESAITRAAIGKTAARVAALRAGVADATVIDVAAASELELRKQARIVMNFSEVIHDFQNQVVYASDAAIKSKPEAVKAYVAGLFDTLAYGRTHKKSVVDFMSKQLKVSDAVAGKVYDELMGKPGFFSTDGKIDPKTLKAMSANFVALKRLPNEVDLAKFVDTSFLPKK